MLLEMHILLFYHWLIWRWRVLNKHYPFRKMEMEVFVKIAVIGTVAFNFTKRNKILRPNILIYFKEILNVIQRAMIVRGEVEMAGFELEVFQYNITFCSS